MLEEPHERTLELGDELFLRVLDNALLEGGVWTGELLPVVSVVVHADGLGLVVQQGVVERAALDFDLELLLWSKSATTTLALQSPGQLSLTRPLVTQRQPCPNVRTCALQGNVNDLYLSEVPLRTSDLDHIPSLAFSHHANPGQ